MVKISSHLYLVSAVEARSLLMNTQTAWQQLIICKDDAILTIH